MKSYLVGGAVRDALLGLPVKDRDWVVVGATPQQMLDAGYQQVGRDFPVFLHPQSREVFVFMMPAILLSGYVSPVENMPQWLQDLTWINPIRHFTDITKQIYLKDASLEIVWGSLWPLLVIAATTGSAAYAMFRRKIA